MRNTKTLYDFQSLSVLRHLNSAIERLTVLDAAGVAVPLYDVQAARDNLLRVLVPDIEVEELPAPEVVVLAQAAE